MFWFADLTTSGVPFWQGVAASPDAPTGRETQPLTEKLSERWQRGDYDAKVGLEAKT